MLIRSHSQRGVTLIELLIGLALIGILTMMAVPAFQHWLQNMQIRNAAEAALNGMQLARAEAVRRNIKVQLVMASGASWTVSTVATAEMIQQRAVEGSRNAAVTILPAGATTITFNGLGWVEDTNNDGSAPIAQVNVTSGLLAGTEIRPLRVVVSTAGATKMCDPAVVSPDTRVCP
jgi:type IV fimbrial biogenesis protein FimT